MLHAAYYDLKGLRYKMYLPEVNRFYIYPVIQVNTTMFFQLSAMQQTDWCVALMHRMAMNTTCQIRVEAKKTSLQYNPSQDFFSFLL